MSFSLLGGKRFELCPEYDSAKSFYGKAYVTFMVDDSGASMILTSYETPIVSMYITSKGKVGGFFWIHRHPADLSNTTWRHIREFFKQAGLKADSKAQCLRDYAREVD